VTFIVWYHSMRYLASAGDVLKWSNACRKKAIAKDFSAAYLRTMSRTFQLIKSSPIPANKYC
jgi:hypothetical protein